ncbi:MAG: hypothetical protein WCX31_19835 [Salinivirgaceae bacterium]
MKSFLFCFAFSIVNLISFSQNNDTLNSVYKNTSDLLMDKDARLTLGGYAQIDYNQPISGDVKKLGTLDVHRMVLLFGYKFNNRTQFITELEFEHVSEVFVEQAFLDYKINRFINFRGGLLLVPMGIINEYHEPTVFNGVERPEVDNILSPTTWREIGFGITGNFPIASLKYQLYLLNGFNGYDKEDGALLSGSKGFRNARQKGAESYISSPNYSAKVEYYGFRGLNLGLATYIGKTQSYLYNDLDNNSELDIATADSSTVMLTMLGVDARWNYKGFGVKGQMYYSNIGNSNAYNTFTGKDMGSAMLGYYGELSYNVFRLVPKIKTELVPFIRYERFNTHEKVEGSLVANDNYSKNFISTGLGWRITPGAVIKVDMQWSRSKAEATFNKMFNAGIGIQF